VSAEATERIDSARFRAKNILFVGIDWKRKGGPVLLEAFRRVRHAHPEATLTIVGRSPEVTQPGVEVVGRLPLIEVARYYRSASIFCLPTLNEPFGLVLLEAFSYGLPIVATRIGAIPEIVEDGESGYLVGPQNTDELADRLIYPARRSGALRALRRARPTASPRALLLGRDGTTNRSAHRAHRGPSCCFNITHKHCGGHDLLSASEPPRLGDTSRVQ